MAKLMQMVGAILWVVIGLLGTVEDVKACSCASASIETRFVNADYVFTAVIISASLEGQSRTTIEKKTKNKMSFSSMDRIEIEFDPLKNYKGSSSDLKYIYTFRGGASCGFEVVIGSIQTFFVKRGKIVGKCGGVLRKGDASEFYAYVAEKGLD